MHSCEASSSNQISVAMIYDVASGAYHHYCLNLANALINCAEIQEVNLVTFFPSQDEANNDYAISIDPQVKRDCLTPKEGSRLVRAFSLFRNIFALLKKARQNHIVIHWHTTSGNVWLDTGFLLACRCFQARIVRTVHEVTASEQCRSPRFHDRALGWLHLHLAHAIIVHDDFTRAQIFATYGRNIPPTAVIPHGNYLFYEDIPIQDIKQGDIPLVLFHGVKRNKGLEVFLKSLQLLGKENIQIRPRVIGQIAPGDEDLAESLDFIPNLEQRLGYLSESDLAAEYAAADIVVFPYLRGTTSGAIHIAMTFNCACVVSDLPCFRSVLKKGRDAVFVARNDPKALAAAIRQLVRDPGLRKKIGESAGARERDPHFSWRNIACDTADVYSSVTSQKKGSS